VAGDLGEEVALRRHDAEQLLFDPLQVVFHAREDGEWGRGHADTLRENRPVGAAEEFTVVPDLPMKTTGVGRFDRFRTDPTDTLS